jgi:hypothetical protein
MYIVEHSDGTPGHTAVGANDSASRRNSAAFVVSLREKAIAAATAQTPAAPVRSVDAEPARRCGRASRSATLL